MSSVAVSNTQIANRSVTFSRWLTIGTLAAVGKMLPGIVSSVAGALPNELTTVEQLKRDGGILIPFTPSRLRTIFSLDGFQIFLPTLKIKAEGGESTTTFVGEFGYIAILRVGGVSVFSEPIATQRFTEIAKEQVIPLRQQQVQLTQQITVPPGESIELELIAFVSILEGELTTAAEKPFELLCQGISGVIGFSSTLLYKQELIKRENGGN